MKIHSRGRPRHVALLYATVLAASAEMTAQAQTLTGQSLLEPSGQLVTPSAAPGAVFQALDPHLAGHTDYRAGQALSSVISPDKHTLVLLTSGYNSLRLAGGALDRAASSEFIFFYDISRHRPVQTQVLQIPTAYAGIAFSPDGRHLYVGSGGGDSIYIYTVSGAGVWSQQGTPIALGHAGGIGNHQGPSTAGLAVTADGSKLAVANIYNDSLSLINIATGKLVGELDLRPGVENAAQTGMAGGETPFWVSVDGSGTAYVSSQRDREIEVVDVSGTSPVLRARIPVQGTPNKMILNRAGTRLFVACDNDDTVQIIDTATRRVLSRVQIAAPNGLLPLPTRYRGAAPNALALSEDERTLYVSDGGENAVAVVGHVDGRPATTALLPTGWYPDAVSVADGWLYVVNGKSDPGPNPGNCQASIARSKPMPPYLSICKPNQYILQLEAAGLLSEPVPTPEQQARLTLRVGANDNYIRQPDAHDAAVMAALHKRIKHIIYIVKENRTYDQMLGDLGRGNGDPRLVEFGRAITPNFHRLSEQFVDLDNFLDSGEVSGNGWPWSTSARETDFNVETIPLEYSARATNAPYDPEGQNRGVDLGYPTLAGRQAADPAYPNDPNLLPGINNDDAPDGPDDDGRPGSAGHGYLWDSVLKARLTVRNYGFMSDLNRYGARPSNFGSPDQQIPEDRNPFQHRLQVDYPVNPTLIPHTDIYFRGFDNAFPDYWRVAEWRREFSNYSRNGKLPSLSLLRLMHDHMGDFSTALDGVNTPELQQADDDYAVGLVAQAVSLSPYKDETLIFVLEDDAQDGPDHVDAHRSTAYVIGPYVKQGAVVSTRYTTVNMLRTIEDILGVDHLNINDAYQAPMTDVFDLTRTSWSYNAVPSRYLYGTTLPLPRLHAGAGAIPHSTHDNSWWTVRTAGYDWTHEDKVPAVLFDKVVWHGLFARRPYPVWRSGVDMTTPTRHAPGPATLDTIAARPGGG